MGVAWKTGMAMTAPRLASMRHAQRPLDLFRGLGRNAAAWTSGPIVRLGSLVIAMRNEKEPNQQNAWFGSINPGRGERIRTSGLYVPNVALYQAKLHPDGSLKSSNSSPALK